MAIKKINREDLNKKVANANTKPVVSEPEDEVVEENVENEVVDEVAEDGDISDTDIPANEVNNEQDAATQPAKTTVKTTVNKTTTAPKTTTNKTVNNKGDKKMETKTTAKKTLGAKAPKKETVERTIGTVYPKDLLVKNIQAALDERFDGIGVADSKFILEAVEQEVLKACQIASVRFLGGVVKAQHRNAALTKSPTVDYHSFSAERDVVTITNAEIGQPEKYRGHIEGNNFVITEALNYEDGKYYPAEGTIDLAAEETQE